MPLVVSIGFMPPSILAVILACLGLAEQLGRGSRLAIGPGGPLVPSGGAQMLAPALGALVVALVIVGHSKEPSSVSRLRRRWAEAALRAAPAVSAGAQDRGVVASGCGIADIQSPSTVIRSERTSSSAAGGGDTARPSTSTTWTPERPRAGGRSVARHASLDKRHDVNTAKG
jgi:hypothetical protein